MALIDHLDLKSAIQGTSKPGPRPNEIDAVGSRSLRKQLGVPSGQNCSGVVKNVDSNVDHVSNCFEGSMD